MTDLWGQCRQALFEWGLKHDSIPGTSGDVFHSRSLLSRKINIPNSPLVRENVKHGGAVYSLGWFPIHLAFFSPRQCLCSASPTCAKLILVIWHQSVAGRYSAVIITLLDYQCVARKHVLCNFARTAARLKSPKWRKNVNFVSEVELWLKAIFPTLPLSPSLCSWTYYVLWNWFSSSTFFFLYLSHFV